MWNSPNFHRLLVRRQNATNTLGNSLVVSYKAKHAFNILPKYSPTRHLTKKMENLFSHKHELILNEIFK